ncbi:MAG: NAD-dependent epimerase/dehydratase family protein, partial [Verrucomicrobiaceae bacterium]
NTFATSFGVKSVGLRYFNIFGERQDPHGAYAAVIPQWIMSLSKNQDVFINGDPRITRDFLYVRNVAEVNVAAALFGEKFEGKVLNVAGGNEISHRLLRSNLSANGLQNRVDHSLGDLRDLALDRKFPLVTGSPPYFPANAGVVPQDSQKAHARFELRGDVSDYARAAVRHLAPGGWFALCFPTRQKQRAVDGILASGLRIVSARDVIPRDTLPPLFTLFACRLPEDFQGEMTEEPPFIVREQSGRLTAEMASVRRGFGFRDGEAHGGHG